MFCCQYLQVLNYFWTRAQAFSFCTGPHKWCSKSWWKHLLHGTWKTKVLSTYFMFVLKVKLTPFFKGESLFFTFSNYSDFTVRTGLDRSQIGMSASHRPWAITTDPHSSSWRCFADPRPDNEAIWKCQRGNAPEANLGQQQVGRHGFQIPRPSRIGMSGVILRHAPSTPPLSSRCSWRKLWLLTQLYGLPLPPYLTSPFS